MSYRSLSPFFHVYNTAQQTVGLNVYYAYDQTSHVRKNPILSTTKFNSINAFTYGEIQAILTQDGRYTIQLDSQLSLNHEGYQVKNVGNVGAMDDGAYGWGTGTQGLKLSARFSGSAQTSDANQTRIWGVRTV